MIELMKFDMGGAAATLGAAKAIAAVRPLGVEASVKMYLSNSFIFSCMLNWVLKLIIHYGLSNLLGVI